MGRRGTGRPLRAKRSESVSAEEPFEHLINKAKHLLNYHMKNTLIALDKSGSYRVYLTVTTEMCEQARVIHGATSLAAAALGRTITAAGLMGLMLKGDGDRLTVQFKGDGPAQEILACANAKGEVKGYIADPSVDLPYRSNGKLDVGGAIGAGTLTVIKDLGLREPYVGRIDLVSGEIAEDLTQYFAVSEQQPSSVALGVRFGEDGRVTQAGGMIIQVMPGASDECLQALDDMLFLMDSLTLLISDSQKALGGSPDLLALLNDLMQRIFGGLPEEYRPEVLDSREIRWLCDCSRERMAKALVSIGKKDLQSIIDEDGEAELNCHFCRKKYRFEKPELIELLEYAQN